jgi:SSS family solute:Na+ symporter
MNPEFHVVFQPLDWLPLALYVVFLLVVGFWPRKEDTEGYMIANRSLSIPVFVATLVATWYGSILGAGQFVYDEGVAAWVAQGLPYYVFAIVFALILARRIRGGAAHLYTIPDKFAQAYDRKTAVLAACFAFFYAAPATYILMAGTLLHLLFGWPPLVCMIVGILFSIVYVFRGGFLSDVRVNTLQFVLMFVGFLMVTGICLAKFGGFAYLAHSTNLPPTHLKPLGTHNLAWAGVWFFIALTTLSDPGFHQRCYAARTPRTAAVGILIAVLCWMLFDTLTTTSGLFAHALVPGLSDSTMAFPALAERVLPTGLKGLFYVGMLAPIMASLVSYTFIAAATVGRDLIWRLRGDTDETKVPLYTRYGLIAAALFSLFIALKIPSVVQQWYAFGNVFVPGMLLPLLGAYAPAPRWKTTPHFAFLSMLGGASVALGWLIWGWNHGALDDSKFYPLGWQPMFPGLLVSAVFYGLGLFARSRPPEVIS